MGFNYCSFISAPQLILKHDIYCYSSPHIHTHSPSFFPSGILVVCMRYAPKEKKNWSLRWMIIKKPCSLQGTFVLASPPWILPFLLSVLLSHFVPQRHQNVVAIKGLHYRMVLLKIQRLLNHFKHFQLQYNKMWLDNRGAPKMAPKKRGIGKEERIKCNLIILEFKNFAHI